MRPVFGFRPSPLDAAGVAALVAGDPRAAGRGVGLIVTPNIDHVRLLRADDGFAQAYGEAEIVVCDGFPVAAYARARGWKIAGRVTGCDIASALLAAPGLGRHRVFLLADSEATATGLTRRLAALGAVAASTVPPHGFTADAALCEALAARIAAHGTTILLLGVGAPRSEIFVSRMRARLPDCWALCVGQALRIEAGLARRAPSVLRLAGVEWARRLAAEPRRLARRYLLGAGHFAAAVLGDLTRP